MLLGATVALTVGAVSLTGTVPTASVSSLPASPAESTSEASRPPQASPFATPAATTAVNAAYDTPTSAVDATANEVAAPPAAATAPAGCTAAIKMVQAARGGRMGPGRAVIASAIAGCYGQLPAGLAGGGSGD